MKPEDVKGRRGEMVFLPPEKKIALITGVTGQDGSYLAELLLAKGYDVHGIVRRSSHFNRGFIEETRTKAEAEGRVFDLHYGDMTDSSSLHKIVAETRPTEIYNLAAQSHVRVSFEKPEFTTDVNAVGVLRLLEAIRQTGVETRFYQASTSELFGKVAETPQTETTPFRPRSPYAIAKLYAFEIVRHYREAYGLHASNGILFNHESPRRGENFVTRKITYSLARIRAGLQDELRLGNLNAVRDWGFAGDYVRAMWLMMQQDEPDDYVIATGRTRTVRDFVEIAGYAAGFSIEWEGEEEAEIGIDAPTGQTIIRVDPRYYRPTEVETLCGDPTKARDVLGWEPELGFEGLVRRMVKSDLAIHGVGA